MACKCKLKLKEGKAEVRTSEFLTKSVHLGKINEAQYTFFADFFPDAFEMVKCSECQSDKIEDKKEKKKK